jgi:membrane fusion protein (multidrug efflux system)
MRRKLAAAAIVLALAFGGYAGWYWWTAWRFMQSTDDAYVASDVSVISPKVEGYIKKVRVEDNQAVRKGDVLFVIDDSDFAAKVAQAEAAVATEEAAVATYASRLDLQKAMIAQAEAAVESAAADLVRTRQDYKRYAALMTTDFASRQRYEQAQADARKADAEGARTRAALVAAQSQEGVLRSQRQEEAARLQQTRANLRLARNDLDDTLIRAPVAGIAGNRAGQIGQYVKPGTELLSLVPLPRVYVTANFKETQLTRIRPGQRAEVAVDAYPDHTLAGKVESFAPASGAQFSLLPPDNATGNFTKIVQRVPIRIALPTKEPLARLLRPGLSVTVTVDTREKGDAVAADAIVGAAEARPAAAPPAEPPAGQSPQPSPQAR